MLAYFTYIVYRELDILYMQITKFIVVGPINFAIWDKLNATSADLCQKKRQ